MPTSFPRLTITETPEVSAWLDDAARAWPEVEGRTTLLKRLLEVGHQEVAEALSDAVDKRQHIVLAASGSLPGVWPPGWHDDYLDHDWAS